MGKRIRKPERETETIVGVLIPSGWGERFTVTNISLACDGEREIIVGNLAAHPEMHAHLRKRILATGRMFWDGQSEIMEVASFRLLDETEVNEFDQKEMFNEKNM